VHIADEDRERGFRFGPLDRKGLIAGWRSGQLVSLAVGVLIAVWVLSSSPSIQGVLFGIFCISCSLVFAVWPIKAKTSEQWLPVVLGWVFATIVKRSRWSSPLPLEGRLALIDRFVGSGNGDSGSSAVRGCRGGSQRASKLRIERPKLAVNGSATTLAKLKPSKLWPSPFSMLSRCTVLGLPLESKGAPVGVVIDPYMHTCSAVLRARGSGFMLKSDAEQYETVSRWGRVLASAAQQGRGIYRLQWLVRSYPNPTNTLSCHLQSKRVISPTSPQALAYEDLIAGAEKDVLCNNTLLVISLRLPSNFFARYRQGENRSLVLVQKALLQEVFALSADLNGADIAVERALSPVELLSVVRQYMGDSRGMYPWGQRGKNLEAGEPVSLLPDGDAGSSRFSDGPTLSMPMGARTSWSELKIDNTWHATYWIAEWPRSPVPAEFLAPLLLETEVWKSVSIVMEPVPPIRAIRQIELQRTASLADEELKRRGGFLKTARERLEKEMLAQKEAELAGGHGQYRFAGYITVSGWSKEDLDRACTRIEHLASQCFLEIRRMYGSQDTAFTYSLPLARGLSRK